MNLFQATPIKVPWADVGSQWINNKTVHWRISTWHAVNVCDLTWSQILVTWHDLHWVMTWLDSRIGCDLTCKSQHWFGTWLGTCYQWLGTWRHLCNNDLLTSLDKSNLSLRIKHVNRDHIYMIFLCSWKIMTNMSYNGHYNLLLEYSLSQT